MHIQSKQTRDFKQILKITILPTSFDELIKKGIVVYGVVE